MSYHTLYLIRHGQYDTTNKHPLGGSLTEIGRQQVAHAAKALKGVPLTGFYTSPLRRAVETAYLIAPHFPDSTVQIIEGLREVVPCIPRDLTEHFATNLPHLTSDDVHNGRMAADETFDSLFGIPDDEDLHTLIIAHGNIMDYFLTRLLDMPAEKWLNFETLHCSITKCGIMSSGRQKLLSYNETGHLPPELRLMT
jgi:serine/threonine-protein phosphatase PGAM5